MEIYHRAGGDISVLEIIEVLAQEGHGAINRNALERWLREDPSRRAMEAAALGQRLRHEAAAAHQGENVTKRLQKSAIQLADLLVVTAKRAQRDIASIEIRTVDDLARVTSCLRDVAGAMLEGFRVVEELRKGTESTAHAPPAD